MRAKLAAATALLVVGALAPASPASAGVDLRHICDPIDQAACMAPFPNDWFTVADRSTATGRRVNLSILATPRSVGLVPIDPREQNRNDGFSPGSAVITRVAGIDLARSGIAPITDIGASLRADAPIVLLDAVTGQRWPYFAELDANATDPNRRALLVRPARNLAEGHRYLVLLRNLRDAAGAAIGPTAKTADLLDGVPWWSPDRERSDELRAVVRELGARGVSTAGVHSAWDFTVASRRSLTERALHLRDEGFAKLAGAAPTVTLTSVTDHPAAEEPHLARTVRGVLDVPSYLNKPGGPPGSGMNYGADGRPAQQPGNVQKAKFRCNVPRSALTAPASLGLFGHGLFGNEEALGAGLVKRIGHEGNTVLCAVAWIGMSEEDVAHIVTVVAELSRFHTIPDRQQQSYLNFLFLGRAMVHPAGLTSLPAFAGLVDRSRGLVYAGASQGGIQGAALTALATDYTRAALIVPAINYSTMLNRSVHIDPFQQILDVTYADKLDQQLCLALMQMLWDRGEGNGYAQHLTTDPLPGTPAHRVLIHQAFGDHQVANIATETMARTIAGVRAHRPVAAPGRIPDIAPFWGIPSLPSGPYAGSAIVLWDSGSPPPPLTNTPPRAGRDPHGDTEAGPEGRAQLIHFLRTGEVIDTCGGAPCTAPAA